MAVLPDIDLEIVRQLTAAEAANGHKPRAGRTGCPDGFASADHPETARHVISDRLTGLYTRAYFERRLEIELATAGSAAPLALFFIDLNGFKQLNDRHGHLVGDCALQTVAAALQRTVPKRGVACRLGGDEFAALVPRIAATEVDWLRSDLANTINSQTISPGEGMEPVRLSGSVGVALASAGTESAADLVARADTAMYAAKRGLAGAGALHGAGAQAPLFGRTDLLLAAAQLREQAGQGSGRLLLLGGEAGAGKTRLAREIAAGAEQAGFAVIWGQPGRHAPLAAIRQCAAKLLAAIPAGRQSTSRLITPGVAGVLGIGRTPAAPGDRPEAARVALGLHRLLAAASRYRPVLWVLDDMHQADSATLAALGHLAAALPEVRAMVLVTASTTGAADGDAVLQQRLAGWWRGVEDLVGCSRWEVQPLPLTAAAELARWALGGTLPGGMADTVARQAGGNPEHVLRLAAGPAAAITAGHGPRSLTALFTEQLAALPDHQRNLVYAAAVLGYHMSGAVLRDLVPEDPDRARHGLDELAASRWLEPDGDAVRFTHPLAREIAYQRMPARLRRSLHRLAGEILAALPGQPPGEVARHFHGAEHWKRAREWFRIAGEAAEAALAHAEAADHYRQHLHLSDALGTPPPDAAALAIRAAQLFWRGEEFTDARNMAQYALSRPLSVADRTLALSEHAFFAINTGDIELSDVLNAECLELLRPLGPSPLLVQSLANRIGAAVRRGERHLLPELIADLLAAAETDADPARVVRWLAGAGWFLARSSSEVGMEQCLAAAENRLRKLAHECNAEMARAVMNVAMLAGFAGHMHRAVHLARRATRLASACNDMGMAGFGRRSVATWLIASGQVARARAELHQVEPLFRGSRFLRCSWLRCYVEACWHVRDLPGVEAYAAEMMQAGDTGEEWPYGILGAAYQALALAARGIAIPLQRWTAGGLTEDRVQTRHIGLFSQAILVAAEIQLDAASWQAARALLDLAQTAGDRTPNEKRRLHWLSGRLLAATGRPAEAAEAFFAATHKSGGAYYRACAHRDLARLRMTADGFRPSAAQVRYQIRAAQRLFRRIGNDYELRFLSELETSLAASFPAGRVWQRANWHSA